MSAPYLFHPSSLAAIMSDPKEMDVSLLSPDERAIYAKRTKTDDEKILMAECKSRALSAGARTYLVNIAKRIVYGYAPVVTTREMEKGTRCEQEAIDLYNAVTFNRHEKNTERRTNDYLTGECDIYVPGKRTKDIKSPWSLETFPALSIDCHDPAYEWQGRSYMILWEVPEHEVSYCMVDTPDDLIGRENPNIHKVSHIDPQLRVTSIVYQRDLALERKIETKCRMAQAYLAKLVAQIRTEHGVVPDWKKKFITKGME